MTLKLNINLPLTDTALAFARRINSWYTENGQSSLRFMDSGPYPHITLIMGDVSSDAIEDVCVRIKKLSSALSCPSLRFTAPHKPASDSRYVFLGVTRSDRLREIKEQVAECLDGILSPSEFGGVDIAPHVTVAYLKKADSFTAFPVGDCIQQNWIPSEIAVSKTGRHGTCTTILELSTLSRVG